ncbi:MAG TPA: hypothetical protein VFM45_11910 [Anaeromyxobacteraceae bacterium]|nr:hypothetical protein [Anaeromyxobacteraceae bacterium]
MVLLALALVAVAWLVKTGLWRRGRLAIVALAAVAALALLTRRVGLGELLVLVAVLGLPALLFLQRAPPRRGGRG